MIKQRTKPNAVKVIGICGASATGKDYLAHELNDFLLSLGYDAGLIVSDTTRPPRDGEIDGVNYNFLSSYEEFVDRIHYEITYFNGWYYGMPVDSLMYDINIGVFDPKGIVNLDNDPDIDLFVIYLKEPALIRLVRSIKREGKFKLEFLRRLQADKQDFEYFDLCFNSLDLGLLFDGDEDDEYSLESIINFLRFQD